MNPDHNQTVRQRFDALRQEAKSRKEAFTTAQAPKIHIGMATCGIAAGAVDTKKAF